MGAGQRGGGLVVVVGAGAMPVVGVVVVVVARVVCLLLCGCGDSAAVECGAVVAPGRVPASVAIVAPAGAVVVGLGGAGS